MITASGPLIPISEVATSTSDTEIATGEDELISGDAGMAIANAGVIRAARPAPSGRI